MQALECFLAQVDRVGIHVGKSLRFGNILHADLHVCI